MRRRSLILASLLILCGSAATWAAPRPVKISSTLRQAQIALQQLGYDPGRVDGRWTRGSTDALMRFQVAQGMPPSGRLDRATTTRLTDAARAAKDLPEIAGRSANPPSPQTAQVRPVASLFEEMPAPASPLTADRPTAVLEIGAGHETATSPPLPAKDEPEPVLVRSISSNASEPAGFGNLAWLIAPVGAVPILLGGGLAMRRRRRIAAAATSEKLRDGATVLVEGSSGNLLPGPLRAEPEPSSAAADGPSDPAEGSDQRPVAPPIERPPASEVLKSEDAASSCATSITLPADMSAVLRALVPTITPSVARSELPADISVLTRSASQPPTSAPVEELPADISILARPSRRPPTITAPDHVPMEHPATVARSYPGSTPPIPLPAGAALRERVALIVEKRAAAAAAAPPSALSITVETRSSISSRRSQPSPAADDLATRMRLKGDLAWIPAGRFVEVAGRDLDGFVYVARSLPRADGFGDDSCLINPGLGVAKSRADTEGRLMGYWPAYGTIPPTSRLAYLDWLADGRMAPNIGIGYVFLFLYGLERRAILERAIEEHDQIRAEIERLIGIYGGHRSFARYATTLVEAIDASGTKAFSEPEPVFEPDGGTLPLSVRIAIGRRVADGRAIDADWMLAWTMSHPETRVRTAARRGFEQLRKLFATGFDAVYPTGLLVTPPKAKHPSPTYRAASGTFEVGIGGAAEGLPDIWVLDAEMVVGRELLEACTDQLDSYSRMIGRRPETAATLAGVALLPPRLRAEAVAEMAENPLPWFASRARTGEAITFSDAHDRAFTTRSEKSTPAKLRELGDILGRFGIGIIPDPRFPHPSANSDSLKLFDLGGPLETVKPASPACRAAMMTMALATLVAKSDGHVSSEERVLLLQIASTTEGVSISERARLIADLDRLEERDFDFASLKSKLSAIPLKERRAVGGVCVAVACGDGVRHANEVRMLERIFRELGLEASDLYADLAGGMPGRSSPDADDPAQSEELVSVSLAGAPAPAFSIAPQPAPIGHNTQTAKREVNRREVDAARLASIRAETAAIGSVLAGVFDLEIAPEPATPVDLTDAGSADEPNDPRFPGLDPKRSGLLSKLVERGSWPRSEFDELARGFGLVPGGALEELNDWACEHLGDVLADDGETIKMHLDLFDSPVMLDA